MFLGKNKTKFSEKGEANEEVQRKLSPQEEVTELEKRLSEKKKELAEAQKEARQEARKIIEGEFEKAKETEKDIEKEKTVEKALPEIKEASSGKISPPVSQVQISDEVEKIKTLEKDRQVKVLTNLAFERGIFYAIKIAQSLDNAYILDEFHDRLVDQLYNELIKKRKLKEI